MTLEQTIQEAKADRLSMATGGFSVYTWDGGFDYMYAGYCVPACAIVVATMKYDGQWA